LASGAELRWAGYEEGGIADEDDVAPKPAAQILEEAPAVRVGQPGEIDELRLPRGNTIGKRPKGPLAPPLEVAHPEAPALRLADERNAEAEPVGIALRQGDDALQAELRRHKRDRSSFLVGRRHDSDVVPQPVRVEDPGSLRLIDRLPRQ